MLFQGRRGLSWRHIRKRALSAPTILMLLFLCLTLSYWIWPSVPSEFKEEYVTFRPLHPLVKQHAKSWRSLYTSILNNDPQCEHSIEVVVPRDLGTMFNPAKDRPRPDLLWVPPDDLEKLTKAHASFIKSLSEISPPYFEPGSRGIAMTAGVRELPVLMISLRMLRRLGCSLPVEVFISTDANYDPRICEDKFKGLNAKCILLIDITRAAETGVTMEKYQFKMMALLFSSYEEVMLLDSDAFPTSDPSFVFDSEPFVSSGLIVWPDFWYASESPYYFTIANLGVPQPLNTRPSSESGQLMVSKSKHASTLMLAAYYNNYGPEYYYPLHSQGGPGQGDKETFHLAATVLNNSFHFVHEPVIALGHVDSNGAFFGSAMGQHDPVEDYIRLQRTPENETEFGAPQQRPQTAPVFHDPKATPKPLFIHANFPKFDPANIFQYETQKKGTVGPTFDSNDTAVRTWMPPAEMERMFGFDIERVFWEEIEHVGCTLETVFRAWEGKKDICYGVQKYREVVFPT